MISYPKGLRKNSFQPKSNIKPKREIWNASHRGMALEFDINKSNDFYYDHNIALIRKRPTPITVLEVDNSKNNIITKAFFEKQATTDYNGVYRGRYIDFEAKSTNSKTSFTLYNINRSQIEHLQKVIQLNGIAFFIIKFNAYNQIFLLDAKYVIQYFYFQTRKSIPYEEIKRNGKIIKQGYPCRIDFLEVVNQVYF